MNGKYDLQVYGNGGFRARAIDVVGRLMVLLELPLGPLWMELLSAQLLSAQVLSAQVL